MACSGNTNSPQTEQNINDGSECYPQISFFDADNNPYTPSSLQYRIDDITNNLPVVPLTSLTPAQVVRVVVTGTQNIMNVASRLRERRQVLFVVGIPGGSVRYDDSTYSLVRKVGTP